MTNNDEYVKALEEFLLDIDCLNSLNKWSKTVNIFDVLKIKKTEIRHSNFLAWLMNPNETHLLGTTFIKHYLRQIIKNYRGSINLNIFDLDDMDLDDLVVLREDNNIDILAYSEQSKFVLCIENKVLSDEHDDQLKKYFEDVNKRFSNFDKKLFIYLTLHGDESSDTEHWLSSSYEELYHILKKIYENEIIDDKVRIYLNDYLTVLGDEFMDNVELKELCEKIYYKHKKALDILIENLPDINSKIYEKIIELLKEYEDKGKVILIKSTQSYIRFVTPKLRNKVGQIGFDTWVDSKDLLVFEYANNKNSNAKLRLYIGPGNSEDRVKYFEKAKQNKEFFPKVKELSNTWQSIYSLIFKTDFDNCEDESKLIDDIIKKFRNFLDKDLDNIVDAITE